MLFTALVILACLFGVVSIAGIVLLFVTRGKTSTSSGQAVGAATMGAAASHDDLEPDHGTVGAELARAGAFRGKGVKLEGEASIGYGEVKAAMREERWRDALPALMAMVGMTGAVCLGLLAAVVKAESKLVIGLFAAVFWYAFVRIWVEFARA